MSGTVRAQIVSTPDGRLQVGITPEPLSVDAAVAFVTRPRAGGVVTFLGVVRDHDGGPGGERAVDTLDYTAHPTAIERLTVLATEILGDAEPADAEPADAEPTTAERAARGPAAVSVVHRVGQLRVGELAVVIAVGAEHRAAAFDAARTLIDRLKAEVPIWKHQRFSDGGDEWVGTP